MDTGLTARIAEQAHEVIRRMDSRLVDILLGNGYQDEVEDTALWREVRQTGLQILAGLVEAELSKYEPALRSCGCPEQFVIDCGHQEGCKSYDCSHPSYRPNK